MKKHLASMRRRNTGTTLRNHKEFHNGNETDVVVILAYESEKARKASEAACIYITNFPMNGRYECASMIIDLISFISYASCSFNTYIDVNIAQNMHTTVTLRGCNWKRGWSL